MTRLRKSRWLRWLKWPGIVVGVLVVLVYVVLPLIVTPMIRQRLQKQISTHLNADLEMGTVYYRFPYGVSVSDAVLVAKDNQGDAIRLLKIPKLKLALARLPFGEGPLVIREIVLEEPSIHLLDTNEGIIGRHSLVKTDAPASTQTTQPANLERGKKLSEMFELRRVTIKDAQFIYEDRESPQTVPAVWRHINIDLTTTPAANPLYDFSFTTLNGKVAELHASGTLNIDELEMSLTKVTSKLNLAAGTSESSVPAILQQVLLENRLIGNFVIAGNIFVPLRRMEETRFDLKVSLDDGSARIAGWQSDKDADQKTFDRIAATVHCSSEPLTPDQALMATAGQMRADRTSASTRPASGAAKLKMPAAYMVVEEAQVLMGDNLLEVKNAAAAYDQRLKEWQVKQAHGTLSLGKHREDLPQPLRAATETPMFSGIVELTLDAQGSMVRSGGRGTGRRFLINLKAQCPELLMTRRRLVATNVSCNMRMTPGLVQFIDDGPEQPAISGNFYGGTLIAHGAIRTGTPAHYDLAGNLQNIDLGAFARDWTRSDEKLSHLSGRAFATLQLSTASAHGGKNAVDLLNGEGTFEIMDGEFFQLPVLAEIAAAITLNKDAGRVGQAAGRFRVANRQIDFSRIAVAAPVLGVQGEGKAGFDGELDFRVVAAPLADWKEHLQRTKVPLLDSVGAELVGGVQKVLNSSTDKLLYHFKVTGTTSKTVVNTHPVPVLTEDGIKLLKEMLKGTGKLLDQI